MLIDTDLAGVPVLAVGPPEALPPVVRRLSRAGAVVATACSPDAVTPEVCERARLGVLVGPAVTWAAARAALEESCVVVTAAGLGGVSGSASGRRPERTSGPTSERTPDGDGSAGNGAERPTGRVVLVGAGPGGLELLTLAGIRALAEADVVLTDRLVDVGDVAGLAPGAEVIDVGKRPGHHAVPQAQIERIMVERARAGLVVVRLKGGDPYVFGRGGEEVLAAVEAGLPVTVVPGVSSAVGVPGAAGIPVTHRGVSHTFTVVSGHVPLEPHRAAALATLGGTVVFVMGMHNLVPITTALVRAGLAAETPAAVVERGLTPDQRSIVGTVGTLPDLASRAGAASPAVIVVGDVVRQSEVWDRRVGAPRAECERAALGAGG